MNIKQQIHKHMQMHSHTHKHKHMRSPYWLREGLGPDNIAGDQRLAGWLIYELSKPGV